MVRIEVTLVQIGVKETRSGKGNVLQGNQKEQTN